jgi:hypothetical protein
MTTMTVKSLIEMFTFPEEAMGQTSNPEIRDALHKAWGGKCAYTGEVIDVHTMHIDPELCSSHTQLIGLIRGRMA